MTVQPNIETDPHRSLRLGDESGAFVISNSLEQISLKDDQKADFGSYSSSVTQRSPLRNPFFTHNDSFSLNKNLIKKQKKNIKNKKQKNIDANDSRISPFLKSVIHTRLLEHKQSLIMKNLHHLVIHLWMSQLFEMHYLR